MPWSDIRTSSSREGQSVDRITPTRPTPPTRTTPRPHGPYGPHGPHGPHGPRRPHGNLHRLKQAFRLKTFYPERGRSTEYPPIILAARLGIGSYSRPPSSARRGSARRGRSRSAKSKTQETHACLNRTCIKSKTEGGHRPVINSTQLSSDQIRLDRIERTRK